MPKMKALCRGCLTSEENMKSLFLDPYQTIFADITDIKVLPNEPSVSWLCGKCFSIVNRMRRFLNNVKAVENILRNHSNIGQMDMDKLAEIRKNHDIGWNLSLRKTTHLKACSLDCDDSIECDPDVKTMIYEENFNYEVPILFGKYVDYDNFIDVNKPDDKIEKFKRLRVNKLKKSRIKSRKKDKTKRSALASINLDKSNFTVIELTPEQQQKEIKDRLISDSYTNARFKCEMCVKVFPYEESLRNHLTRHEQSYGTCECDTCHQRFNKKQTLKSHCRIHSRRYQCRICDRQLHFRTTMAHHLLRHNNTYFCRICGHRSMDKTANRLHQKEHSLHETYKCLFCMKIFSNKYDYNVHVRRHTGDMPYVCNKCDKCFQTSAGLETHKAVHSNVREFYCAKCDVSFKTKETMLSHFKRSVKHIDPSLLNFSCEMCPKKFKTKSQLAAHIDSYHLRKVKLSCDICPAQFVSLNGLRNHKMRKHEGVRPAMSHVCETCGRRFSTKALVTNHLRTHTGEQPFECETCHRRFSQKSAMQTHIKLVHLKLKRNIKQTKKPTNE